MRAARELTLAQSSVSFCEGKQGGTDADGLLVRQGHLCPWRGGAAGLHFNLSLLLREAALGDPFEGYRQCEMVQLGCTARE